MLNDALRQSKWSGKPLTPATWRRVVERRVREVPWERIAADVVPLLEDPEAQAQLLTREAILKLLAR